MKESFKEEKVENMKKECEKKTSEGVVSFEGFEEVEDIVTAGSKGTIVCCRDV